MNQPEQDRLRDELADRLMEQSLGEVLGRQTPPDLSQQIAAAAEREGLEAGAGARPQESGQESGLRLVGSDGRQDQPARRMGQTPRWPLWSLSAAAGLLLALGLGFWAGRGSQVPAGPAPLDEVEVFFARTDLEPGTLLAAEHLASRKVPRNLAPKEPASIENLLGQMVRLPVLKDDLLDTRRLGPVVAPKTTPLTPGGELAHQPQPEVARQEREFEGSAPIRVLVGKEQRWVFPPRSFEATLLSENVGPRSPGTWLVEHSFYAAGERPVAQVPIHGGVDSWSQFRKLLDAGGLPAADDVRLADWLNYFATTVAGPDDKFVSLVEVGSCPWQRSHRLLRAVVRAPQSAHQHVQLHVEFNPAEVSMWRLLGHEHRASTSPNASLSEGGNVGRGQLLIALFEIVPAGSWPTATAAPLRFQSPPALTPAANSGELCALRLQLGAGDHLPTWQDATPLPARPAERAQEELKLAGAVAAFALLLRGSPYAGEVTYANVERLVEELDLPELGERQDELLAAVQQVRKLLRK